MPDGPRVLDCLEFDPRLRIGDVLLDVAFLAMDLERLGRPDLATRFLRRYVAAASEHHPESFAHYYVAHRALVRAKVAALRLAQGDAGAEGDAVLLLRIARRHLDAAQVRVLVVGGLPGAGKTTLATQLAKRLPGVHLSSDAVRWELCPDGPSYDDWTTDRVYDTLLARAADAVARGEHVVLDASWSAAAYRAAARAMAAIGGADLLEVQVAAEDEVAEGRLAHRHPERGQSQADARVRQLMTLRFAPWPQAVDVDVGAGAAAVADRFARHHSR
jgi:predicted kinase